MKAVVSEKGQVTIPKALRSQLGIRSGQQLEFREERGRLIASKVERRDPVERVFGILKLDTTVDKFVDELRGAAKP